MSLTPTVTVDPITDLLVSLQNELSSSAQSESTILKEINKNTASSTEQLNQIQESLARLTLQFNQTLTEKDRELEAIKTKLRHYEDENSMLRLTMTKNDEELNQYRQENTSNAALLTDQQATIQNLQQDLDQKNARLLQVLGQNSSIAEKSAENSTEILQTTIASLSKELAVTKAQLLKINQENEVQKRRDEDLYEAIQQNMASQGKELEELYKTTREQQKRISELTKTSLQPQSTSQNVSSQKNTCHFDQLSLILPPTDEAPLEDHISPASQIINHQNLPQLSQNNSEITTFIIPKDHTTLNATKIQPLLDLAAYIHENPSSPYEFSTMTSSTSVNELKTAFLAGCNAFGHDANHKYEDKIKFAAEGHRAYDILSKSLNHTQLEQWANLRQSNFKKRAGLMKRYCTMLKTVGTAFLQVPIPQVFFEQAGFSNDLIQMFKNLIDKKPLKIIDSRKLPPITLATFNITDE